MNKGEGEEYMQCSEILKMKENADGSYQISQCTREGVAKFTSTGSERNPNKGEGEPFFITVEQDNWLCNHHKNAFLKTWSMGFHINHNERCIAGDFEETLQKSITESKAKAEELDPDGSIRIEIREKVNNKIKAKQEKIQAEREADLLLEVSMFRETLPLLWRMIRRKIYNDRELTTEEVGMEGHDFGRGELEGAIDGPLPRIAEIQRHIEWFIETYDMEWPDINLAEMWDSGGKASAKWSSMMKASTGNQTDGDVDEWGDMRDF